MMYMPVEVESKFQSSLVMEEIYIYIYIYNVICVQQAAAVDSVDAW